MRNVRKWIQFVLSLALIAFAAASAAAPQKQFTLTLSQAGPLRIAAKLTNTSPNGNSSFNSFDLDLGGVIPTGPVTLLHSGTSSPSFTADLTSVPGHLRISGLTPVGRTEFVIVTFGLQGTCPTAGNVTVSATVWTGSSFSGETFVPLSGAQSVSAGCDTVLASCEAPGNTYPEGANGNSTTLTRKDDKDPLSDCPPVAVNVVITPNGRTVHIQWDEATYPNLVLETDTTWPIEAVDDPLTGAVETFPKRTRVAWCPATNLACSPVFIEAQLCNKSDSPTTADNLATMPTLPPGLPAPYNTQVPQRARACIISEAYEVKTAADCTAASLSSPCVIVNTIMYVVGDPWLSRQ